MNCIPFFFFSFPLKIVVHPPRPQGPLILSGSKNIKIHFKNVFHVQSNFVCEVNSPEFLVETPNFSLFPKQVRIYSCVIVIYFLVCGLYLDGQLIQRSEAEGLFYGAPHDSWVLMIISSCQEKVINYHSYLLLWSWSSI